MVLKIPSDMELKVMGDIWTSDEAYKNLVYLCDEFGSRFPGTPGEKPSVDWLVSKLKEYGLENVEADEFVYTGWRRGGAKLELLEPRRVELCTQSLALCPPTPREGIEGELVYLDAGFPEHFNAKKEQVKGRIVVCTSQPKPTGQMVHRRTKYGYSVEYGAVGFIFINHNPGQLMPTGSLRPAYRMAGEIPGIGVSWETGCQLVRMLKHGPARVRITTTDVIDPEAVSWNVVGLLPGSVKKDREIVVGAHFEGHDIAVGALDDGSGAVVVMEAARALAKYKGQLKRTIRFILFSAEEIGVTGSTCYVDKHSAELDKFDVMINCDGAGRGLRHHYRVTGPEELVNYVQDMVDYMNYDMKVVKSLSAASDHWPFYMQGIPAVTLSTYKTPSDVARVGRGWAHTSADTLDKVDKKGLKDAALVLANSLIYFANEPKSIARHMDIKEIIDHLEKIGMAEILRIQKKWHPESIR